MKLIKLLSLFGLFLVAASAQANTPSVIYLKWQSQLDISPTADAVATSNAELDGLLINHGVEKVTRLVIDQPLSDPYGLNRVLRLHFPTGRDLGAIAEELRQLPGCEYAVLPPQRHTADTKYEEIVRGVDGVPNDPFYPEQYMFPLMRAPSAWNLTEGQPSIVIAIVDNGTDWEHPDLYANIWENPGEIPNNNVDDDENGFIDDIRGWDFHHDDNDPMPLVSDYHGTHTAGLAGAMMNNSTGVVGMAPGCKIMPIQAGEESSIYTGIEGILYASQNNADVISLSWGGAGSNPMEQDIVSSAIAQGAVIVAAAGNSGLNEAHYPAAYVGVIAVANSDNNDQLYSESNYGEWVSVCAPGVFCLSLVPNGYGAATGTSMSTPLVAGVAGLVKSYHPTWDADRIRSQILFTADDIDAKNPSKAGLLGSGRVNAFRAVSEQAPGLQLVSLEISETSGDMDGKLEPGESADFIVTLKNEGETSQNVQVTLSSNNSDLQVTEADWTIPTFSSGVSISNASAPFEVYVQPDALNNSEVELTLSIEAGGFYSAEILTSIWISPAFGDHDVGNVIFTVTEFGAFGYYDKYRQISRGSGFKYPPTQSNALYHGSLMIGDATTRVSDNAYGSDVWPYSYDFTTLEDGELQFSSSAEVDQLGAAAFDDSEVPIGQQVGVVVTQTSYAWADTPNDDYVIVQFNVTNTDVNPKEDLYVGLYMDWDVQAGQAGPVRTEERVR
ncbi:S8 family serine peptidase, partial [bacterium]|nr:S8 family serine peptidase [bacterium]